MDVIKQSKWKFFVECFMNYTKETLLKNIRTKSKNVEKGSRSLTLILTVAIGYPINSPNTLLTRGTLGLKTAYREAFQKDSGNKIMDFNPRRMI